MNTKEEARAIQNLIAAARAWDEGEGTSEESNAIGEALSGIDKLGDFNPFKYAWREIRTMPADYEERVLFLVDNKIEMGFTRKATLNHLFNRAYRRDYYIVSGAHTHVLLEQPPTQWMLIPERPTQ